MKIAFVSYYDAQDINSWSGTSFYMSKAFIEAGIEVEFVGPLKYCPDNFSIKVKDKLYNKLFKKRFGAYHRFYDPFNLKYWAHQVSKKIEKSDVDIIFSPDAFPIAYLDSKKPIVLWADSTFAVMRNYYSEQSGFSKSTIRDCNHYEINALNRVRLGFFSSEWAAKSAINDYNAAPDKIKFLPYGANIDCKRRKEDIVELNKTKSESICKLLFIGKDWKRKGGDIAINVAKELNTQGIRTELRILGCTPPNSSSLPDYVKVLGFVDKSKKEGLDLINRLYCESHFFILPTIADCTPMVFPEANSFGLPVITRNTGGISSVIKDNVNGKMFDSNFDIKECAVYISNLFTNPYNYNKISLTSFNEYNTILNWNTSIGKMINNFKEILK